MALIFGNEGNDFIVAGPDGKHVVGGLGNDFIRGGDGGDFLMGNEGDDWIEGGGRFDTLAGENSELFFNSSIIGHDVLNGNGSDTDYDAESGDDIMFQNAGIQRSNGMAGFDWGIHKGDPNAANTDLGIPLFTTQEAFILRDRFDLVEGLSGWKHDDTLTGRVTATNARAELQNTAAIPGADSPLDSYSNALLEKNVALIDGLDFLVAHKQRTTVTIAGVTETIVMNTADASDILLGGGGSDLITGLAGDDIIDGDRWLNVRIEVRDALGNAIGSADGMAAKVLAADGSELFGGRTLDALMFDRTLNPGQLHIVREILDGEEAGDVDVAAYIDIVDNYTFVRNSDGSITVTHAEFDDADPEDPNGEEVPEETAGNRVSDGTDRLFNIEALRFSDGNGGTVDIAVDDLPFANTPATGAPVINDLTPTEGQALTVDVSSIADAEGLGAFSYQWQVSDDSGTTWSNLLNATGASFTPNDGLLGIGSQVGDLIRVAVSFTDGNDNAETLFSAPTGVVGDNWDAIPFLANTFNGTAGDDIADGTSGVFGLGANDTLNGNAGNDILNGNGGTDTLNGGAGNDTLAGGAGNDTAVFAGPVGNFVLGSSATNLVVTDLTGAEGTDTLSTVEMLRIAGVNYSVVAGTAASNANLNGAAGATGSQAVFGFSGTDALNGGAGNDLLLGGEGNDAVGGGVGNDTAYWTTGDGRDFINGGADVDTVKVVGDASAETFRIYSRTAALAAGLTGLNANTEILITRNGTTNAAIVAELDNIEEIVINGRGGDDTFLPIGSFAGTSLSTSTITIEGSDADDRVDIGALQSAHRVVFKSSGGNDVILGEMREQDLFELADGKTIDDYTATENADGSTTLATDGHSVTFFGSLSSVQSAGVSHDDHDQNDDDHDNDDTVVTPPNHDDTLTGTAAHDVLKGGSGDDDVSGRGKDDSITGGSGDDRLDGGDGDDGLSGGSGDDTLLGRAGDDALSGGSGDDRLDGGAGDDVMIGGNGKDSFVFSIGDDQIADFDLAEDVIDLSGLGVTAQSFASRVVVSQSGNDTLVRLDGHTLRLDAVSAADVQNASFIFATGSGNGGGNVPPPTGGIDTGSTPVTPTGGTGQPDLDDVDRESDAGTVGEWRFAGNGRHEMIHHNWDLDIA